MGNALRMDVQGQVEGKQTHSFLGLRLEAVGMGEARGAHSLVGYPHSLSAAF